MARAARRRGVKPWWKKARDAWTPTLRARLAGVLSGAFSASWAEFPAAILGHIHRASDLES